MKKLNGSIIVGLILLIVSIFSLITGLSYSYRGNLGLGPGFFPVWISVILLSLTLIYMFKLFRDGKMNGANIFPKGRELRNILYVLACMVIFVLLFNILGFIASGTVFLFLLLRREYTWYKSAFISVASSLFLFLLFGMLLGVELPLGFGL